MSETRSGAASSSDSSSPFTDVALIAGPTKHLERRREVFEELWAAAGKNVADPDGQIGRPV